LGDPSLPSTTAMLDDGQLGYNWFVGFAPTNRPHLHLNVPERT